MFSNNLLASKYIQQKLQKSLQLLRDYDWLLDSYVLDFYVDNHWSKLPKSWRTHLETLAPENLAYLLDAQFIFCSNKVWPLSLLALKQLLFDLCLSRQPIEKPSKNLLHHVTLTQHPKLKYFFTKCIKPKKRHEILEMAAICKRNVEKTQAHFVIDFGAGLGHLARILGYGYGIKVCCLEMQQQLNEQASLIDLQFENVAQKYLTQTELNNFKRPQHVTLCLSAETQPTELLNEISKALNLQTDNYRFGIIGLHPCGDLGVILMRLFFNCKQAKFLNFVGCCYMKLTTKINQQQTMNNKQQKFGYPLSKFLRQQKTQSAHLSYEAREISCHAIEMYSQRLSLGAYENLKVHSFRAATERILIKHWPQLKHCGLKSVKCTTNMEFEEYFYKAVQSLPAAQLPLVELQTTITRTDLLQWKQIVIFYTLRLMFAPLVESIILYDRLLYLMENDCHAEINAIFEPHLSPRNHITCAYKNS